MAGVAGMAEWEIKANYLGLLMLTAARGHALNEDATVVASAAQMALAALPAGDPVRPVLRDALAAAQRIGWVASSLLNLAASKGVFDRPMPIGAKEGAE